MSWHRFHLSTLHVRSCVAIMWSNAKHLHPLTVTENLIKLWWIGNRTNDFERQLGRQRLLCSWICTYMSRGGNFGTNIDTSASCVSTSQLPPRPYLPSSASNNDGMVLVNRIGSTNSFLQIKRIRSSVHSYTHQTLWPICGKTRKRKRENIEKWFRNKSMHSMRLNAMKYEILIVRLLDDWVCMRCMQECHEFCKNSSIEENCCAINEIVCIIVPLFGDRVLVIGSYKWLTTSAIDFQCEINVAWNFWSNHFFQFNSNGNWITRGFSSVAMVTNQNSNTYSLIFNTKNRASSGAKYEKCKKHRVISAHFTFVAFEFNYLSGSFNAQSLAMTIQMSCDQKWTIGRHLHTFGALPFMCSMKRERGEVKKIVITDTLDLIIWINCILHRKSICVEPQK